MQYTIDQIKESINTKLWLGHPFLAQVMVRMGVDFRNEPENEHWAWNDGLTCVINVGRIEADNQIANLSIDHILFLVGHELLHTITATTDRRCGRDPELWNIASDFEINSLLIHNQVKNETKGIGKMPSNPKFATSSNPEGYIGCYNRKYIGWSAEAIYDDLLQQCQKQQQSSGDGEGDEGEGNGGSKSLDLGDLGKNLLKQSNQKQWDDHENQQGGELTQDQKAQLKAEIKTAVKSMENSGDGCGKGSSTIFDRMMEELFKEPPFDWRGFLDQYLRSYIKDDYTWKHPGRRSQGVGTYMPGNATAKTMKIAIAIDTSGSVGNDELSQFFAHINKIMKSFKSYQVDVWCFSTLVHLETFKSYTQTDSDITAQKISTTGGTEIASNFEYLEHDNPIRYDCFIILTDGCDSISDLQFNKYPVIWGIIDNKSFKAPEGVMNSIVVPIEFDEN